MIVNENDEIAPKCSGQKTKWERYVRTLFMNKKPHNDNKIENKLTRLQFTKSEIE